MRVVLRCLHCQETAEHVVEIDGDGQLAWCQNCFRVWRGVPVPVAALPLPEINGREGDVP